MRRSLTLTLLLPVLVLGFAGCGSQEEEGTPAACIKGPSNWLSALQTAGTTGTQSEPVEFSDETLISDCIPADQPVHQQEKVGQTAVELATSLSAAIRTSDGMEANGKFELSDRIARQAGYLVGALEKGSESSEGIHAALVERVRNAATNGLDRAPGSEKESYEAGYQAGLENG